MIFTYLLARPVNCLTGVGATLSAAYEKDFLTSLRAPVLRKYLTPGMRTLEIGAYTRPLVWRPEFDAHFLDFYSTQELQEHCRANNQPYENVVPVDYVVRGEDYLSALDGTFDVVIANHVLEHIKNPIAWLIMIGAAVREGGLAFISLPDKRVSFDKFRDETSIAHILCDYLIEGRDLESEHCIETEIFYDRQYIKLERSLETSLSLSRIKAAAGRHHPGIHCHVFNGSNFLNKILNPLIYMKLIPWSVLDYVEQPRAGEFYMVLKKGEPHTDMTADDFFSAVGHTG